MGTGKPLREFMYVDDLAEAVFFLMERYNEKIFVNIGQEPILQSEILPLL
jgi:GDP-L-fucose synthase